MCPLWGHLVSDYLMSLPLGFMSWFLFSTFLPRLAVSGGGSWGVELCSIALSVSSWAKYSVWS